MATTVKIIGTQQLIVYMNEESGSLVEHNSRRSAGTHNIQEMSLPLVSLQEAACSLQLLALCRSQSCALYLYLSVCLIGTCPFTCL